MKPDAYAALMAMQDQHWWYTGRRTVVDTILRTNFASHTRSILDIGSGFGGMLSCLLPYGTVDCTEPNPHAWNELRRRGAAAVHDVAGFPDEVPDKRYDLVTMFDVLEHIEDDRKTLRTIYSRLLSPAGAILLTVPAHNWLWSRHDTDHHHFRRYTMGRLKTILTESGFESVQTGYFMSYLFPIAVVQRIVDNLLPSSRSTTEIPSPVVNRALTRIFVLEGRRFSFRSYPIGLSIAALAYKNAR